MIKSRKVGIKMDTIKIKKGATQIVAHRGLSGIEKENTNSAFVAAGNRSYYGIETDIRRTIDGRFVICHDGNLNRIAGVDVLVESTALSDLQSVVLLDVDGNSNRTDLRVSVLEDYISICKKYDKHCVLELKLEFTEEEISQIIDIFKSFDYLENVTFITFYYSNITMLRSICPMQSVQLLFSKFDDELIAKLIADRVDADVRYTAVTKELISVMHEHGLKVNCWTVNDKDLAEQLCEWDIDYITTNILE